MHNADLTHTLLALAARPAGALPEQGLRLARFSLFDWMICGRAGIPEPVSTHLRALAADEAGRPEASLFGAGKVPARMAALVNGTTAHALDFDDTHFAHVGHLSVGIYPTALAIAEQTGASAPDVVSAFLIGAEAAIRVGLVLGAPHYNLGFHQTATAGAFGATIAAARLLGLSQLQTRNALGLCATRASGLKSQFGTMGKPYNAGVAAANGVECAKLAAMGLTAPEDGLMGPQGFIVTHTPVADPSIAPVDACLFEDIKYKFHACCHGTHAMIEALLNAQTQTDLTLDTVAGITLKTSPRWLSVCNIPTPATGLEVKFSYAWLAGMVLQGIDTGSDQSYTDALCADSQLAEFAKRVTVIGDPDQTDMQADCLITLQDGRQITARFDLDAPLPTDVLDSKLRAKAKSLLGAQAPALFSVLDALQDQSAADLGRALRGAD